MLFKKATGFVESAAHQPQPLKRTRQLKILVVLVAGHEPDEFL
jgi:hypothetical protein